MDLPTATAHSFYKTPRVDEVVKSYVRICFSNKEAICPLPLCFGHLSVSDGAGVVRRQTLPLLPQLLHLHLQTLDFVSKVLLEEPVRL